MKEGTDDNKREMLRKLAEVDPAWALDHLTAVKITDPDDLDTVRGSIAEALVRDNADEAAAVIESIADPARRALVYAGTARDLMKRDPARARQHLDQAILNYRIASPTVQSIPARPILGLLLDLGEVERARELLKTERLRIESQSLKEIQRPLRLGPEVLVPLARIDPATALAELETLRRNLEKDSRGRASMLAYGTRKIAFELADRSPADAERLLRNVWTSHASDRVVDTYVQAVSWKMAPRDLTRAKSLTDLIASSEIELKPFALGLIAKAWRRPTEPRRSS